MNGDFIVFLFISHEVYFFIVWPRVKKYVAICKKTLPERLLGNKNDLSMIAKIDLIHISHRNQGWLVT